MGTVSRGDARHRGLGFRGRRRRMEDDERTRDLSRHDGGRGRRRARASRGSRRTARETSTPSMSRNTTFMPRALVVGTRRARVCLCRRDRSLPTEKENRRDESAIWSWRHGGSGLAFGVTTNAGTRLVSFPRGTEKEGSGGRSHMGRRRSWGDACSPRLPGVGREQAPDPERPGRGRRDARVDRSAPRGCARALRGERLIPPLPRPPVHGRTAVAPRDADGGDGGGVVRGGLCRWAPRCSCCSRSS